MTVRFLAPAARRSARILMGAGALLAGPLGALASNDGEIAAVSSQVSRDYSRVKLADGSFQPETYTFGEGGRLAGAPRDPTIDSVTFLDVAKVVAPPLAKKNYVPVDDRNPEKTKLLIMVYWGATIGTSDASDSLEFQNLQRGQAPNAPPTPPPRAGPPPRHRAQTRRPTRPRSSRARTSPSRTARWRPFSPRTGSATSST